MVGIILYLIVAAAVLFVGYNAYQSNDSISKDKIRYVVIALLLIALFWPLFVLFVVLMYVIYKTKIWKNVKELKDKLESW
jgi:uncharacterized membrane protein YbhN (UPF0104 family)